jgi:polyhydroxyalkanoate synthesis regulator phasin
MTDIERIEQRLAAVERTVVDGDFELDELADVAALAEDVERIESRLEELERRVADLEGSAQAVEGYVSNIEAVNDDVERRADAAVAAVDRLERRVDELDAEARAAAGSDGVTVPAADGTDGDANAGTAVGASGAGEPHPATDGPAGSDDDIFEDPSEAERAVDDVIGADGADRRTDGDAQSVGENGQSGTAHAANGGQQAGERSPDRRGSTGGSGTPTGAGGTRGTRSNGDRADSESVESADQESVERSLAGADGGRAESADTGGRTTDQSGESDESGGLLASLRSKLS